MADDATVDVADLVKQHSELGEQIVKLGGKIKYPENDDADLKAKKALEKSDDKDVEKVEKSERVKLDKHAGDVKKAKKKGGDAEDAADGGDDEDMEDDWSDKGTKDTKKAAADDETLTYKGLTIKKSVVGAEQFSIMKGLAEDVAKSATDIAKAQDDALIAKLEKRADDEFPHVPGSTAERAQMLKAISKMDAPLQKTFEAVFKANEALAQSAFKKKGTGGGDMEDVRKTRQDFDTKVSEIKKRDSCTNEQAMSKARQEHPDLFKAYQETAN